MRAIQHFINGKSRVRRWRARWPRLQPQHRRRCRPKSRSPPREEVDAAVQPPQARFPAWAATNPQRRARVMFEFKRAGRSATWTSWRELLSSEHGKVIADSKGDIQRGLEVIEFACGIPHALKGEYTEGAGPGIDVYSMRQPLGVVRGHHAVQLPGHDPDVDVRRRHRLRQHLHPEAVASATRSVPVRLAELMMEAGAPAGVLQRRPRRQGGGRRHPRPSGHQGGQLRRLVRHRPLRLLAAAPRTGSACRPWAAPRTTASSCPTPTSTRS